MGDFLFDEFPEVSAKQWKQKIQVDLKGDDYNETLVWTSPEGIHVKPFYHKDDFIALDIPGLPSSTAICQQIYISDVQTANYLAKDALNRGASALEFVATEPFDSAALFDNLNLDSIHTLHFNLGFLSESFLKELSKRTAGTSCYFNIDPIGTLSRTGNWHSDQDNDLEVVKKLLKLSYNNHHVLGVDISLYQNAGATMVQELAYGLAQANDYLNLLSSAQLAALKSVQFNFSVGSNYFSEIAKLRAFRYLWKLLSTEYEILPSAHFLVRPTRRNKTIYDYNTNMLRTSSECMSALLGGADTISNLAYDAIYHKKNEFGERIARNQLLILQQESNFKSAAKITEGTYYIEALTKELAEQALKLFQSIENSGGFLAQLNQGTIQRKINESAQKEQAQFDSGALVIIGSNKFPNKQDLMKSELELYPFLKINKRKTSIEPILPKRLTEQLEKDRLDKE